MKPSDRSGPLSDYRVLELGSTVAGPFCGRLFADFGAEVIKVEPAEGDPVRSMGKSAKGRSLYAASILRNKSLISLDLRTAEGREIVKKIAENCDVVVENFRPGVLEKWGLGYEDLRLINPRIVMIRISGYGQTGPYKNRAGYGIICEAFGGLRYLTGDPDRPPARVSVALTDYITGLYAFAGGVMALLNCKSSGTGQFIDAALYESAFSLLEQHIAAYEQLGVVAKRTGAGSGGGANNLYPTNDGELIHIAANGGGIFKRLCVLMDRSDLLQDTRFIKQTSRNENHEVLDEIISSWSRLHKLSDLETMLQKAQVPATRIFTLKDIFEDSHYRAREAIVRVPDDELGSVPLSAIVPKLSVTPGKIRHSGRRVGQDTLNILTSLAGLTPDDIARLKAANIIYCDDRAAST